MSHPRFRRITKTRALENIRRVRAAAHLCCLEVETLQPGTNHRHAMRMQSILGAGILNELRDAQAKIERAAQMLRTIKR